MSFVLKNNGFAVFHSTKQDGNMGFDFGTAAEIEQNRRIFFEKNQISVALREIINCHSSNVSCVSQSGENKTFYSPPRFNADDENLHTGTDGIITFDDIAVFGITGDCIPLAVWEPGSNLLGLLHIGLLGGLNGILHSFKQLADHYKIDIGKIKFYLGPGISVKNYNITKSGVWKKIGEQAVKDIPEIENYITKRDGHLYYDNRKFVRDSLIALSASPENILSFDYCTAEKDSLFYSHYYQINNKLPNARFLTLIQRVYDL
jgi:copper oxidase (laccase) domain-containing protein